MHALQPTRKAVASFSPMGLGWKRRLAGKHQLIWRRGFTLIELMVVILIIAILLAFLLPAIGGPRYETSTLQEIAQLATAMERYKIDKGEYPPVTADLDQNLIRAHLLKCYPSYRFLPGSPDDPVPMLARLRPDQSLVFWLGGMPTSSDGTATGESRGVEGFSTNPKDPFRAGTQCTWSTRRNSQAVQRTEPYFRFDPSRLRPPPSTAAPQEFWVYVPPGGSVTPYVYFRAEDYGRSNDPNRPMRYTMTTNGVQHSAVPYREWPRNAGDPLDVTSSNRYMAGETFQILSAGQDGIFGEDARASAAYDFRQFPSGVGYSPNGYDEDNLTSFSQQRLGKARP